MKSSKSSKSSKLKKAKAPVDLAHEALTFGDLEESIAIKSVNGLSDKDAMQSFVCKHRERNFEENSMAYYVDIEGEYDALDFKGKIVLINGRERKCSTFEVIDGKIVIIVNED